MKILSSIILSLLFFVTACASSSSEYITEEDVYGANYVRFLNNVTIKQKSANVITYEYKDARVDELAILASQYCQEQGKRTAILRDITLYKTHSRWVTFDCLSVSPR